ncbi:hypothetical protein quinque_008443 [Culex quinquefasciatus]
MRRDKEWKWESLAIDSRTHFLTVLFIGFGTTRDGSFARITNKAHAPLIAIRGHRHRLPCSPFAATR